MHETLLTGNSCIPQKWMINHETKIVLFMKVSVPSASLSVCLQGAVTYGPGMRFCCRTKPVLFECSWFVSNSSAPTQNPSRKNKLCALRCFNNTCFCFLYVCLFDVDEDLSCLHEVCTPRVVLSLELGCLILLKRKVICQHFICIFN